jgi:uncharacterized protein (UPF0248 family)
MQPIHELLARIRWDAEFGKSRFAIGYWDRVEHKILRADLHEIAWDADNPSFFDLIDEDGLNHSIPFHRVREVWRDGVLIWRRQGPGETTVD